MLFSLYRHQPLFVYIVIAKTCYWLIILFQIGQDKFLLETSGPWEASATLENTTSDTYSSDSGEIQANDNNGSRSLAVEVMICGNTTSIVLVMYISECLRVLLGMHLNSKQRGLCVVAVYKYYLVARCLVGRVYE
jgi:hypothetical protein